MTGMTGVRPRSQRSWSDPDYRFRSELIERDAELLDEGGEFGFLTRNHLLGFGWRGRGGREVQRRHLLLDGRHGQHFQHTAVQLLDNRVRRAGGYEQRIP